MLQNCRKNSKKLVSIIVENYLSAKTLYCGENKKKKIRNENITLQNIEMCPVQITIAYSDCFSSAINIIFIIV